MPEGCEGGPPDCSHWGEVWKPVVGFCYLGNYNCAQKAPEVISRGTVPWGVIIVLAKGERGWQAWVLPVIPDSSRGKQEEKLRLLSPQKVRPFIFPQIGKP